MVDVTWNRVAPLIAKRHGYLAADRWRLGMDNETRASLRQSIEWVRGDWIDFDDGFDYAQAAKQVAQRGGWPKTWFIAGRGIVCWAIQKMSVAWCKSVSLEM